MMFSLMIFEEIFVCEEIDSHFGHVRHFISLRNSFNKSVVECNVKKIFIFLHLLSSGVSRVIY